MYPIRINPLVVNDLNNIWEYYEDDQENAARLIEGMYSQFESIQMFPKIGSELSKRVHFKTDFRYLVFKKYIIIYKFKNEIVEIYRVINRYQDITRIFE